MASLFGERMPEVLVTVGEGISIPAFLAIPQPATGLVLFAHGSGSSRHSPRNRFVADALNEGNIATLLLDLLTPQEEAVDRRTAEHRFNIGLLARRLIAATHWARSQPQLRELSLGYFGASTGAAAALVAAAALPDDVAAVVSRGGRPDLAGEDLRAVRAPTLLIVGGADRVVIELNRQASNRISATRELVVVPGATHLFEEEGALEEVARLSRAWFERYLCRAA
jgi:putative phosphoribosyl transferase